jgi:hypothetical protein
MNRRLISVVFILMVSILYTNKVLAVFSISDCGQSSYYIRELLLNNKNFYFVTKLYINLFVIYLFRYDTTKSDQKLG